MSQQYKYLKQEAQIYEHLTGKKCSIFHNNQATQQTIFQLPSATKHRAVTEQSNGQSHRFHYRKSKRHDQYIRKKLSLYNPEHRSNLYSNILKQGIKMTIMQENKPMTSKEYNNRRKTSPIRRKISLYQERINKSLNNNSSDNKINLTINKSQIPESNIISSSAIQNQQLQLGSLQTFSLKNPINFLSLNKSSVVRSKPYQNLKKKSSTIKGLIGNKKEKLMLDQKNREESLLQKQIMEYHCSTRSFIDQIKQKYKLNFYKHKKYLKKIKHQSTNIETNITQSDLLIQQGIKCDKLTEEVRHLNFHLKENKKKFEIVEQNINNNEFHIFIQCQIEDPIQSTENYIKNDQQQDDAKINHRKLAIIEKLKKSLINMRLRDQQEQLSRHSPPIKVNERLKDILFHY